MLRSLAPHLAEGLRAVVPLGDVDATGAIKEPGLLPLVDDLSLVAITAAAQTMPNQVADWRARHRPQAITALAARLKRLERGAEVPPDVIPRARLQTRGGRWLVAHAIRRAGAEPGGQIAVILNVAQPVEIAPLLLAAYALTPRGMTNAALVLAGRSTDAIAAALVISPNTVQQHLKAMFGRMNVRSHRHLVARILV